MCNITNKKTNRRIGYKVLGYRNDKFYSTFTGQEITEGKVPKPPTKAQRLNSYWTRDLDYANFQHCYCYNSDFAGKTAAFTNLFDAIFLLEYMQCEKDIEAGIKLVIVKIKFTGNVYKGTTYNHKTIDVVVSDNIDTIEIIL